MTTVVDSLALAQLRLPAYHFTAVIHQSETTTVYRAVEGATQRPVVVKALCQDFPSLGTLAQFRNQFTITQSLPSQGIVRPLALLPYGNGYALVMADEGGIDLGHYIRQQPLSLTTILKIGVQLADTLHTLHHHRVIHKDIKPANLLFHPATQQVQLIDFSIASRLPAETQGMQNPAELEGTLAYLAPEQTGRMNRAIDYRTDFYALGVTLYELLTGQLPFPSPDPLTLIHCHIAQLPPAVDQRNPKVPPVVAAIVAKLMAKNAEDRYQSALGLKHDFERCLSLWPGAAITAEFPLGERDVGDRFTIPEKLYGREIEVQTLLNAFDRVAHGASEMMLVAGFSGIGKTAVVNEVHKPIVKQRGYFIKGKFDQVNRNIPFSAFVQALRNLVRQLLGDSDAEIQTWRTKILAALGDNAQVMIDLIPELGQITGPQPPAPTLSGTAAQHRFNLLFQRFIRVFATAAHPLVIFIDDLQWSDAASLHLMQVLLMEPQTNHVLLLGAYRDNEVFPGHPLMATLDHLAQAQVTLHTLTLPALSLYSLNRLIADTLGVSLATAQPLTDLVMQKTQGNPFFATQFLKALHQDQFITFDYDAGHWQCDLSSVQQSVLTDDVVALMGQQLQKLPQPTQTVLKLAACVGAHFDLNTLAIVSEQALSDVAIALWPALENGMVLPQGNTYKFYLGEASPHLHPTLDETTGYRFLHDRIQQAAYSLIEETQRQATHLAIGRLLQKQRPPDTWEDHIFEIVNQINIGRSIIRDQAQWDELVRLNLMAAQKAIAATAYAAAFKYAEIGIEVLGENGWESHYQTTLTLYTIAAKTAYLDTQFERAEHYSRVILKQARSLLDKITIYEIEILIYAAQKNVKASALSGLNTLALLGIEFPDDLATVNVLQALANTDQKVRSVGLDHLASLPRMEDPKALAAMRILSTVAPSVYKVFPTLYPLIVFKQIDLSITYGNADLSAFAYAAYGLILCGIQQDIDRGYRFGKIAEAMLAQFDSKDLVAKVCAITNAYINPWKAPLEHLLPRFLSGYQGGLAAGDLEFGCYCAFFYCTYSFYAGRDLAESAARIREYNQALRGFRQGNVVLWNEIHQHTILKLLDSSFHPSNPSEAPTYLEGQESPLEPFPLNQHQTDDRLLLGLLYINKLYLNYLFGQYDAALDDGNTTAQYLDGLTGMFTVAIFYFYDSLARLSCLTHAGLEERAAGLHQVRQNQEKMAIWAASCPENCQHKYDLVAAEYHRVQGHKLEAVEGYDRAIAGAKAHGYPQEEALANELAMGFYLDWGKQTIAEAYAQQAYYAYARWGAKAKVVDLETRYPELLRPILQPPNPSGYLLNTLMTLTSATVSVYSGSRHRSGDPSLSQSFDFASILEAAQLLASTLQLDELLHQLPQIVLKNSGGDRCVLLLPDSAGNLQVRAIATLGTTECICEPLADGLPFPVKLIQYVKNRQETVIVNDTDGELPVDDPYLASDLVDSVESLACLPILGQDELLGIVYLSSQATRDIFDANRIAILSFLCSQAATALANAKLYDDLHMSELHYRALIRAIPDLIMRIGKDGRYLEFVASPNFQVLGNLPEWVGQHVTAELPLDVAKKRLSAIDQALASQKMQVYEQVISVDDQVQHEEVRVVPNGQNEVLLLVRDISDRKLAEAALRQQSRDLEKAMVELQNMQLQLVQNEKMSALGGLIAGVAHEINNPLGCIIGNVSATRDYISDLLGLLDLYRQTFPHPGAEIEDELEAIDLDYVRADLAKLIQAMQESGDRIKAISRSLRTFSRSDTNSKQPFNLHDGLDSTVLILRHRLKGNDYRPAIEVVTDYGDIPEISCFPGQLNQVFMNILANAVDAFDEVCQGRSFQEIASMAQRITIRTARQGAGVQVTIADNGPGIPHEIQDQIFDHLFTTKGVGKGTGLGLAIARQIVVDTHGGSLTVTSQMNQGTEFAIQLPL